MTTPYSERRLKAIDIMIGNNLKKFREAAEFSRAEVGRLTGLSPQQITKYEAATNRLSASRVFQMARVLNVDPCEFYDNVL